MTEKSAPSDATPLLQRPAATHNHIALDVVRVSAALIVALGHARGLVLVSWQDVPDTSPLLAGLYTLSGLGHQAVIVFFALSGLWVGGQAHERVCRQVGWLEGYVLARLCRLWVVLVPAILITFTATTVALHVSPGHSIWTDPAAYYGLVPGQARMRMDLVTVAGNLVFLQGLQVPTVGINGPLWSIAYEFWYYATFPAILVIVRARRTIPRLAGAAVIALAVLVCGAAPLAGFAVWLGGAVVGVWNRKDPARLRRLPPALDRIVVLGAIGQLVVVSAATSQNSQPESLNVVLEGASALLLLAVLLRTSTRPPRAAFHIARLARSTYSLYAVHFPLMVVVICAVNWEPTTPGGTGLVRILALMIVGVAVSVLVASLTEHKTKNIQEWAQARARSALFAVRH